MAEWSNALDCKSGARKGYVGSNPALGTERDFKAVGVRERKRAHSEKTESQPKLGVKDI